MGQIYGLVETTMTYDIAESYASYYGLTFEEFVERVSNSGVNGVEFIPDQQPNLYDRIDESRTRAIRELLEKHDLFCTVHNVFYDINIVSLVPDVQLVALNITEKVLRLSRDLGAKHLTVHPGYMFPGWRKNEIQSKNFWESASVGMEKLGELGAAYGVVPLIENGSYYVTTASWAGKSPLHVGISPYEMKRLLDAGAGRLGVCFDFNKAVSSGHSISDYLSEIGPHIRQVQVSNVDVARKTWESFVRSLAQSSERVAIVIEGPRELREELMDSLRHKPADRR